MAAIANVVATGLTQSKPYLGIQLLEIVKMQQPQRCLLHLY